MPESDHEHAPGPDATLAVALSDELLAVSRRAMDAAMYETAYHALAGALHAAEAGSDGERLLVVQDEAARQQDRVDAEAPDHRLSRPYARERGRPGWYDALVVQTRAVLSREHATAVLDRAHLQQRTQALLGDE